MQKSLLKLLGAVAGLMLSASVSAVGMGGVNVTSALGQPLKADIELVSVSKADKASLVARLASPDSYKNAGLEYPFGNKFKFQIESRANGDPYIKASSAQPINDPYVSLLVELTWASGKLLREYTFLLDPPDYVAEQPKPAEVQAVAAEGAVEQTDQERRYQQEWIESTKEQPQPVGAAPEGEKTVGATAVPTPEQKQAASVATGNITVQRGDTLNKIAMQNKPAEVSLERMLVALYRANADQFDGKNMNRIKAGKILRLPDQKELMSVAQSDAAKEIRAHTANWNAYRQKLAAAAPAAPQPQEAQQVATGKIASSVADKAPVAKESAKEVLKLSKGEAPGDKAAAGAAGKPAPAQDKKDAEQEDAIAKDKSLKEEQARATMLEKNLKDMDRLAKLKSEAAVLATQPSGVAPQVTASAVASASEVKPAPVAKPKPRLQPQPVVAPQPSLVDQIMDKPLYLIGGAAILLGLGGFVLWRRKQTSEYGGEKKNGEIHEEDHEDAGTITGRMAAPAAPSPAAGDFTSATGAHPAMAPPSEEVDPISEADLFLNFGRDVQAEEILKDALQSTPNNHQIHLKLLGIYANRKDVNSFSSIARKLKDSGDEQAWQQAAAMGHRLEPNNPMYAGAGTIEDDGSATMQTTVLNAAPDFIVSDASAAPDVDFDLSGTPSKPAMSTGAAQAEVMDFDVTSTSPSLAPPVAMDFDVSSTHPSPNVPTSMDFDVSSTHPSSSAPTSMDFDITSSQPAMPAFTEPGETALPNLDDLIFDVSAKHPSVQPETAPAKGAQADEGGLEFTLDFPVEDMAGKPAPAVQPADIGFGGISLNLDDFGAPGEPAAGTKDEHWHEVATKFDLAKAYQEMGDAGGAREILEEVLREGDEGQRKAAQSMLDQLG
ncbi:MAG TPA: FimV/HubP family polar landmark protein [Gallionella sp.]|nr:FimV/HubP family polar landmark protein [Gallionella sp.]